MSNDAERLSGPNAPAIRLTKQQLAAILLCVPCGTDWLDKMIEQARRERLAQTPSIDELRFQVREALSNPALEKLVGSEQPRLPNSGEPIPSLSDRQISRVEWEIKVLAALRYMYADAMLDQSAKGGE